MNRWARQISSTFHGMLDKADYLNEQQRQWAEARWLEETILMYSKSVTAERLHAATTFIGVFASLATPVAAGIAVTDTAWGVWARPVTLIIGLLGAAAVAANRVIRTGPRWRFYRSIYEDLAAEGWAYFNAVNEYSGLDHGGRFEKFFDDVENVLSVRRQRYMQEIAAIDEDGLPKLGQWTSPDS